MSKEKLRLDYENACNAYLMAFCEKHGFDFEESYWCGDEVGGIADCSTYTFDMATIRTDIDEKAPESELMRHYDYCLDAIEFGLAIPNFHAWIHGCPRTSKGWFVNMRKMREDFENSIKRENDKNNSTNGEKQVF